LSTEVHHIVGRLEANDVQKALGRCQDGPSDGETIVSSKDGHIQRLVNGFGMSLNRVRGELPIIAMTQAEFNDFVEHTAKVFDLDVTVVRQKATNPDQWRKDYVGDGVARLITDLQPLLIPPSIVKDPKQLPELQAGHHRFEAMAR
jgi:hypothetical protein